MRRRDDWNHYSYTYGEGQRATVDFDVMAAVLPDAEGHDLRVVAPADREAEVEAALHGIDALLLGVLRYADKVEWVLNQAGSEVPRAVRLPGVQAEVGAGWRIFNDRVCPSPSDWRRIEDREALARLDLDHDGELRLLHRFFGASDRLRALREVLRAEGFEVVAEGPERLTMSFVHPIPQLSAVTVGLLRLCEGHGAGYDGWVLPG